MLLTFLPLQLLKRYVFVHNCLTIFIPSSILFNLPNIGQNFINRSHSCNVELVLVHPDIEPVFSMVWLRAKKKVEI